MNKIILFLLSFVNKVILILLSLVLLSWFLISFNFLGIKDQIYETYPNIELRKKVFSKVSIMEFLYNDYSEVFLPETQFGKLNFEKIKLNFLTKDEISYFKTFYLETIDDKIWIIDFKGNFFEVKINDIKKTNNKKSLKPKIISSNLITKIDKTGLGKGRVLGTLVHDGNIYIAFHASENNCKNLKVEFAKINEKYLNFENFFSSKECGDYDLFGGKMQFFEHDKIKGLLLTTSDISRDKINDDPQSDESIFGKVLFIDFKNKNHIIFSKGHRNPAGLYAENNLILSTEHGPRGGDEINKIIFNKNYGWPISSYGEKYYVQDNVDPLYKKNHLTLGFEEPVFSYLAAIGISQIIKLPNNFSKLWVDNFIISSLWGRSLYRVKFDTNYNKIIYSEQILIGQRIRDLKYHNETNTIFLALEEEGDLGILKEN